MGRRTWIKIFSDNWLRGSIRKEKLDVRCIFIDLLAMAGDSAYGDDGIIQLADGIGFTDEMIAGMLNVTLDIWQNAKNRLSEHPSRKENRIEITPLSKGFAIKILNWSKYQSEYRRQKKYRGKKKRTHEKSYESGQGYNRGDTEKEKENRDGKSWADFDD